MNDEEEASEQAGEDAIEGPCAPEALHEDAVEKATEGFRVA